jgi:cytochrome b561
METTDTTSAAYRYSTGAIILHWIIAIAVIAMWRIAEAAEHAGSKEEAMAVMAHHKALGIVILLLTLARLAWRVIHRPPPLSANLKPWERILAHGTHMLFYVLLVGLPIGGWIASSFYRMGIEVWSVFTLPALPLPKNEDVGHFILEAHAAGGTFLLLLVVLHVAGALKHQFVDRDGNLFRMLPFGTPKA